MPTANWYSTNSDLTVLAEVICQQQHGGGNVPTIAKLPFLGPTLCRGPTKMFVGPFGGHTLKCVGHQPINHPWQLAQRLKQPLLTATPSNTNIIWNLMMMAIKYLLLNIGQGTKIQRHNWLQIQWKRQRRQEKNCHALKHKHYLKPNDNSY